MFELVLRIGFSLLVVFGLMWGWPRWSAGRWAAGARRARSSVLNRQQLSRGAAVAVVRVGRPGADPRRHRQQVSLLGETDLDGVRDSTRHESRDHRDPVPAGRPCCRITDGMLDGSLLSPRTWSSTAGLPARPDDEALTAATMRC